MHRNYQRRRQNRLLSLLVLEREDGVLDLLREDGWLSPREGSEDTASCRLALVRRAMERGFPVLDETRALLPLRAVERLRIWAAMVVRDLHPRAPPAFSS